MGSEKPMDQCDEEVIKWLKEIGMENIVEDARAKLAKARLEGKKPWQIGQSDCNELLDISGY